MAEKKIIDFNAINKRIVEEVDASANKGAVDKVVSKRVDIEIQRRAELIDKALDKYNEVCKNLTKCQPDVKTFVVISKEDEKSDGATVEHKAYSEAKFRERANLQKLQAELDIAIMKAFGEDKKGIAEGYAKLQQLVGSGKQKNEPEE